MKRAIILFLLGSLLPNFIYCQIHNWNPDPNGEPWISGPQPEITTAMLSTLTSYQVPANVMLMTIPASWVFLHHALNRPLVLPSAHSKKEDFGF